MSEKEDLLMEEYEFFKDIRNVVEEVEELEEGIKFTLENRWIIISMDGEYLKVDCSDENVSGLNSTYEVMILEAVTMIIPISLEFFDGVKRV